MKSSPNNKTPGADGIPVDFYKVFWKILAKPFMEALKVVFEKKILYISARRGVITLILKKDRDMRFVKNWRPITLLNADYKIVEKTLANRMKPVLNDTIHSDQTGFLPNRRISHNIRKIFDIILIADEEQLEAIILSLDFEKCFDRIEHHAINNTLQYYGFGPNFIQWTSILYNQFTACLINNGSISEWFSPSRGGGNTKGDLVVVIIF